MKRQLIFTLVLIFLSVFIFGDDSNPTEEELEKKIEELENQQAQMIQEIDELKRENAKTETQDMYQKEQWGQGAAVELTIPLTTMNSKPLLLSLSWLLPKIDNKYLISLGFDLGFSRTTTSTEDIFEGYFYSKLAMEQSSPLLFNFSRTFWGLEFMLGPDITYDLIESSISPILNLGISSLYTGIEFFSNPHNSFFFEAGFKNPLKAEWNITERFMNFGITASPYFGAGLRFYM